MYNKIAFYFFLAVGGSLANSRLTLSSRGGTPVSLKSGGGGGPLVDESVQVDLSADTITYDSDDEMVKRRSSLVLRNKKGHPIYSKEDIREQYCINRKEISARPRKFLQRLARPISSLLHASMIFLLSVQHLLTGYGMEARFESHMPSYCTVGTVAAMLRDQLIPALQERYCLETNCIYTGRSTPSHR
ncbi:RNase H domain-containing protein [Trichonephila clavipes]|nr:RNase H domain-containing protein [Trichonephila clavipes]